MADNYFEIIKANKTWICPIGGRYKIVCVGGGESGGFHTGALGTYSSSNKNPGGSTSFGSILTAAGGSANNGMAILEAVGSVGIGGNGGYTLTNYGGIGARVNNSSVSFSASATINGGTIGNPGIGYGASGGAIGEARDDTTTTTITNNRPRNGLAGEVNVIQTILERGKSYVCIIGAGGVAPNRIASDRIGAASQGLAGAIIIQALF